MSEHQPPQNQSTSSQSSLPQPEALDNSESLLDYPAEIESVSQPLDEPDDISRLEGASSLEDVLETDAQSASANEAWDNGAADGETADREAANRETVNRESELLSLIHDLNECNDALLMQVSKLEEDLQRSQAEASAEVEKASAAVQLAQEKMSRQVSAEQASAQQVSQAAQQQVARLVGELDTAEQRLSRQMLVSENLETELSEAQTRIAQLERECALMAEKHAEEVRSRVQAETNSRDLRSRLQRQQRYTLQFKAALEKSLSVGISPPAARAVDDLRSVPFTQPFSQSASRPVGVSMPRSQRIMPWASASDRPAFQGIDPHLEALIRRGNRAPSPSPSPSRSKESQVSQTQVPQAVENETHRAAETVSLEAEARLWQDLARVMTTDAAPAQDIEASDKALDIEAQIVSAEDLEPEGTGEEAAEASQSQDLDQGGSKQGSLAQDDLIQDGSTQDGSTQDSLGQDSLAQGLVQESDTDSAEAQAVTTEVSAAEPVANEEREEPARAIANKPPRLNWQAESRQAVGRQTMREGVSGESSEEVSRQNVRHKMVGYENVSRENLGKATLHNRALAEDLEKAKQKARMGLNAANNIVADSIAAGSIADSIGFTAPSPWIESPAQTAAARPAPPRPADYLPAVESAASPIAPVAKPLRPQKKIGSFAAVQLPTFPSAKSDSFKR